MYGRVIFQSHAPMNDAPIIIPKRISIVRVIGITSSKIDIMAIRKIITMIASIVIMFM